MISVDFETSEPFAVGQEVHGVATWDPRDVARARAFADAGADVLFVEAPTTEADIERVADALCERGTIMGTDIDPIVSC